MIFLTFLPGVACFAPINLSVLAGWEIILTFKQKEFFDITV